jgi:phosphatidate cytidylyltransferase
MIDNLAILKTTCLVYACLFGGAILLTLLFRRTNWGRNITVAIVSWLVIFCLFFFLSYAGRLPFTCLIVLLAYGAVREFYTINGVFSVSAMALAALHLVLMAVAVAYARIDLFYAVPLMAVFVFFPLSLCMRGCEGITLVAAQHIVGLIYWGWLPMHFLLVQRLDMGFGSIVLLCSMLAVNDNSAYYVGKLLGRNSPKLAPKISPGKTWVGFWGGFAGTVLVAVTFGYAVPRFGFGQRLLLGILMALVIPIGDLLESAMKRDAGVKDSGFLIPGHGGVMDRFDSWSFVVPLYYYFLVAQAWV